MGERDSSRAKPDVSVLYDLAMAAGRSLDLKANCEAFLKAFMPYLGATYAGVWVKADKLKGPRVVSGHAVTDEVGLVLAFALPDAQARERVLPAGHRMLGLLGKRRFFSIGSSQKGYDALVAEHNASKGACLLFPLGEIGVLKLHTPRRDTAFLEDEVEPILDIVEKFGGTVHCNLTHQELVGEVAGRIRMAESLRQSEEKYRDIVERASDGILIIRDGLVAYVNSRMAKLVDRTPEEMTGTQFARYLHPAQVRKIVENYRRRMAGEPIPTVYETVLTTRDGTSVNVEFNAAVITYQGKPADLVFIRDVSERKKAESEVARLALAVEQTADAVVITDTRGVIQYVNPAFERISGYSRSEAIGQNPRLVKSGKQDFAVYRDMWAAISRGEVWRGRFQNRRKDGSLYTCDTIITPTRDAQGQVVNYVSVQRDVTRELQMEEQYLQAQKMESIGRLAGGIAHDFNNIMTAILGFGSMILDQVPEDSPLRHPVEQIVSSGERATNLTRQLLSFSRRQMAEVRVLDVNAVLAEMYHLLRRALGEDVELITLLDDDAGNIKADAGLLQQLVMNLAINASDAMVRGGRLTIRTSKVMLDERFHGLSAGVRPGPYIFLSISDTGHGMSKEVMRHVFEPFFTTKPKGKGTGLGLATVYGIVRQCGGHIEIQSEPGVGTEAKIWLPRIEPVEAVPVELEEKPQRGNEMILVVEDEDVVRDLTVRILKTLGYRVMEASNGREALKVVEAYRGTIHLVLTDVVMPQMDGPEMAERIMQLRPGVKVLYTSGFTESVVLERGIAVSRGRLIQKPYTREILAQVIRETLDAGQPPAAGGQ